MKTFTVTIGDDGAVSVSGDVSGEFGSLDELVGGLPGLVGAPDAAEPAATAPAPAALPPGEMPPPAGEDPGEEGYDEAMNYARKSGTRPKVQPGFDDYFGTPPAGRR